MLLSLCLLTLASAFAGEHSVDPTAMPGPVLATLASKYSGATVSSASTETEDGVQTWEAKLTQGARSFEAAFGADGSVLEEEEVVKATDLPPAVQAALAGYAGWTIGRIEKSVTPTGTRYEAVLTQGKQGQEIGFAEDGSVKEVEKFKHHEAE